MQIPIQNIECIKQKTYNQIPFKYEEITKESSKLDKNTEFNIKENKDGSLAVNVDPKLPFYLELKEIKRECSISDWNGYGALPIPQESILYIEQFVKKLPYHYPIPETSPLPNERMGLEWDKNNNSLLLSIDKKGMLYWTALMGNTEKMGKFNFAKNEIADELLKTILEF